MVAEIFVFEFEAWRRVRIHCRHECRPRSRRQRQSPVRREVDFKLTDGESPSLIPYERRSRGENHARVPSVPPAVLEAPSTPKSRIPASGICSYVAQTRLLRCLITRSRWRRADSFSTAQRLSRVEELPVDLYRPASPSVHIERRVAAARRSRLSFLIELKRRPTADRGAAFEHADVWFSRMLRWFSNLKALARVVHIVPWPGQMTFRSESQTAVHTDLRYGAIPKPRVVNAEDRGPVNSTPSSSIRSRANH